MSLLSAASDKQLELVADMAEFIEAIRADSRYTTCLATVGKGEFIAVKAGN